MTLRFDDSSKEWKFSLGGSWRTLADPYGPPTGRQLLMLAHRGLLEIRAEPERKITKLEAARAIDQAREGEE